MKVTRPSYFEPHNYPQGWGIVFETRFFKAIKAPVIYILLTAFFAFITTWSVDYGRHHCIKKGHYEKHKTKSR